MAYYRRFASGDMLLVLVVLLVAGGVRFWYLSACCGNGENGGPLQVQDASPQLATDPPISEMSALIGNLKDNHSFSSLAPLAHAEEATAHISPGYPWLLYWMERSPVNLGSGERTMRWVQALLGTLTAMLYYLFTLRAFGSRLAALLAGLLCAVHPFWIVNIAEINDGVISSFLLAASLALGARASQEGSPFSGLLFGLCLAGLSLVRAALLPFGIVALLWFLLRCRNVRRGWLCALLALLGFGNGLATWTIRNHKAENIGGIVPIVDSTFLHLWIGNNPHANGGPLAEDVIVRALAESRGEDPMELADALAHNSNQRDRYDRLAGDVAREFRSQPEAAIRHRIESSLSFVLGSAWSTDRIIWRTSAPELATAPFAVRALHERWLYGSLLAMCILALLGWRWSYAWRAQAMPASLALIWIPIPYILSHAEAFHGPRLPLDGVLLCYAAFALACAFPTAAAELFSGPDSESDGDDR
jgi:4-amino-4-deoxy-L-arabinose transferase-like glycosyltransferase